jgi:hypothetical protein
LNLVRSRGTSTKYVMYAPRPVVLRMQWGRRGEGMTAKGRAKRFHGVRRLHLYKVLRMYSTENEIGRTAVAGLRLEFALDPGGDGPNRLRVRSVAGALFPARFWNPP